MSIIDAIHENMGLFVGIAIVAIIVCIIAIIVALIAVK